ncbi:MAG: hypothetical protein HQK66_01275 [Desulfamplus sp.]|nr:hypothetical protein [Desulfamplus sp.]
MKSLLPMIVIAAFSIIGYFTIHFAPPVSMLRSLEIPVLDKEMVVGSRELGQGHLPSGERHHLGIRYTDRGMEISNKAVRKKIEVETDTGKFLFLKRIPLLQGDRIEITAVQWKLSPPGRGIIQDRKTDRKTDHKAVHPSDHKIDHQTVHESDHKIDHQTVHQTVHQSDHKIDHQPYHKTEYPGKYLEYMKRSAVTVEIISISPGSIALSELSSGIHAKNHVKWDKGKLKIQGDGFYTGNDRYGHIKSALKQLKAQMKWYARGSDEIPLFSLGGSVNMHDQWALPGTEPVSARIVYRDGNFYLAPGNGDQRVFVYKKTLENKFDPQGFHDQWMPVSTPHGTLVRCIIGRTHYLIKPSPLDFSPSSGHGNHPQINGMELVPFKNQRVFHEILDTPNHVILPWIGAGDLPLREWLGNQRHLVLFLLILSIVTASLVWHFGAYHRIGVNMFLFIPGLFVMCALVLLHRAGSAVDMAWSASICAVSWIWATWSLSAARILGGRVGWIWICVVFLAGSGVVLHLQLAAGSDNTRWLSFAWKQAVYVAWCGFLAGASALIPRNFITHTRELIGGDYRYVSRFFTWIFTLVLLVITFWLMITVVRGDELGVGVFQLSELMKLFIAVAVAYAALDICSLISALSTGKALSPGRKLVFMLDILSIPLFLAMIALSSFALIRDFSPVIIIIFFILIMTWQLAALAGRYNPPGKQVVTPDPGRFGLPLNRRSITRLVRAGVAGIFILVFIFAGAIHEKPNSFSWLPKIDRFRVWSTPDLYPHTGGQINHAMDIAAMGRWMGSDSWFGINMRGNTLPAVQDDFALAFLLYKFGGIAGMLLLFVQTCHVILLWGLGRDFLMVNGDYVKVQAGIFLGFFIQGLALIHALQWSIAWGNTLGLLPVMGQPMTWLSSGNSHLASVGLPLILAGLTGNRIVSIHGDQSGQIEF